MPNFKIFYSWQSDLSKSKTRYFIRKCIDEAIDMAEESEAIDAERDEATIGTTGSPNIVTTLFSKIDNCDLFIADISLCFTENGENKKKSPNPNVMLELGYAVKKLGWERVLCVCNVDYGKEYPFDIAHNRITNYALEGKNKKEVEAELAKIIFKNIRDIKKLKPIVKAGMATHIIGKYDFKTRTVSAHLSSIDIKNSEGYILHNQELLIEAKKLVDEIKNIAIKKVTTTDNKITPNSDSSSKSLRSSSFQNATEKFDNSDIPVVWKESDLSKEDIKYWLEVEVPDDFFELGDLKYSAPFFNIFELSYKGTDNEIKKHEKLLDLKYIIAQLFVRTKYLKTFENICFIPLAIQNISAIQDENIRVVISVDKGEIIEPNGNLIYSELEGLQGHICRNDDDENDVGLICELFGFPEDGFIHTEEIPYNPKRNSTRKLIMTPHGIDLEEKNEEDYALELQEFIATTGGRGYYEFIVDSLRPGECKWMCCGLLIKPIDKVINITYQIHSTYSSGDLTDTLEWDGKNNKN